MVTKAQANEFVRLVESQPDHTWSTGYLFREDTQSFCALGWAYAQKGANLKRLKKFGYCYDTAKKFFGFTRSQVEEIIRLNDRNHYFWNNKEAAHTNSINSIKKYVCGLVENE